MIFQYMGNAFFAMVNNMSFHRPYFVAYRN